MYRGRKYLPPIKIEKGGETVDTITKERTTAKWEIWEQELIAAEKFENPFLDVELQAVLKCQEHRITVDGFYDGETENGGAHVFRLRFAPMYEGEWQYETVSNCPSLNGRKGSFICTPPVSHGGLVIDPKACHWFAREDGTHQMIVNDGWFPHAANGHWISYEEVDFDQPSEEEMKQFIDLLAEYGVNLIVDMSQLYARQASITDTSFAWPWKVTDPKTNKVDKDRFNLEFYRRWERTLAYCCEKEMFFAVELLFDNSTVRPLEWSHHPINRANGGWLDGDENGLGWGPMFDVENEEHKRYTERYLRYTIARLAPYRSVLWEMGGENANLSQLPDWMLAHCGLPNEKVASWYNYWGEFMKKADPYSRPCTYGDTTYQSLMVKGPGNHWVLTQDPRNYPRDDIREYYRAMNRDGIWYWQYDRPMVIGEMNSLNNGNYGRERRMYWTAMVSGYHMGRSDRHFGLMKNGELVESRKFLDKVGGIEEDGRAKVPPIYPWLALMRNFVETKAAYWNMSPDQQAVEASEDDLVFCLSDPGEEYLLYVPFGGSARLTVDREGIYSGCWLNPVTGEETETRFVSAKEQGKWKIVIETPNQNDWVLYIKREKGSADE